MTTEESEERPAEGGKPEGVRGRTTTTVRFTAARLADLRAAAAIAGPLLKSEEVEFRIEALRARRRGDASKCSPNCMTTKQQIGSQQQNQRRS